MLKPVLLALFLPVIYCNGQMKPAVLNFMQEVQQPLRNIRSIFQDKKGNYWFGTNDSGVFRYNGKILEQLSEKDGLSNNQVQNIQEDHLGQLWFSTGVFGVSKFDGKMITTWSKKENIGTFSFTSKDWKVEKSDLWFYTGLGVQPHLASSNDALALLLFMLVVPLVTFITTPLSATKMRQYEFEADAFACEHASGQDLRQALLKLYQGNASTLTPDPLYVAFYHSHPPAAQRLGRLTAP